MPTFDPITRPVVLISWDGQDTPWKMLHLDASADFEYVLFDYSGRHPAGRYTLRGIDCHVLSEATECKGQIFQALAAFLIDNGHAPEYVALIDDDIAISVRDINRLLHLGRVAKLDCFAPGLSHDSPHSHTFVLRDANRFFRPVDWVEVMMPFYRGDLFLAGAPHYKGNISSWGIDKYLLPTLQMLRNQPRTAVVDAVCATHMRPVTSGQKVYANGLTADQEARKMRQHCLDLIDRENPALKKTDLFDRLFLTKEPTHWKVKGFILYYSRKLWRQAWPRPQ